MRTEGWSARAHTRHGTRRIEILGLRIQVEHAVGLGWWWWSDRAASLASCRLAVGGTRSLPVFKAALLRRRDHRVGGGRVVARRAEVHLAHEGEGEEEADVDGEEAVAGD